MSEFQSIACPYCWQSIPLEIEAIDGPMQYVEDCSVCCQPILIDVKFRNGEAEISARREND